MKNNWTANKIASLEAVRKIATLPFETSLLLSLYDDSYAVSAYKTGKISTTGIPLFTFIKLLFVNLYRKNLKIALIHNHPAPTLFTGNGCLPSGQDSFWAFVMSKMCHWFNVSYFDSIIVNENKEYFSFKESFLGQEKSQTC